MGKSRKDKPCPAPSEAAPAVEAATGWLAWALPLALAVVTFIVFSPALGNEFVNWDDYATLTDNPYYRGLGWRHIRWMFTTFHQGHYMPLSWLSYGLDYVLWGMDPRGYHLTNVLLHCANALLFFFLARRLLRLAMPGPTEEAPGLTALSAAFAALFFAIHPLRTQSVAWATERRDVLCGFFFLLALLLYLRAQEPARPQPSRRRCLAGTVAVFILALLSKETAVMLAPLLVILDIYPLGRFPDAQRRWTDQAPMRVWLEKLPFFLLVLAEVPVLFAAHIHAGVPIAGHSSDIGLAARPMAFSFTVANQLWRTLVPAGILPVHYLPVGMDLFGPKFVLSAVAVAVVTCVLAALRKKRPALLAAWAYHAVSFSPLLVLLGPTAEITGGRFAYLPCLGIAALAGAGFFSCWRFSASQPRRKLYLALTSGLAVSALAGLGLLAWLQARLWHDSITVWNATLRADPKSYLAHFKLGDAYARQGDLAAARRHYESSLRILPNLPPTHIGLADVLLKVGEFKEAVSQYQICLQLNPTDADVLNDLGNAYFLQGDFNEAAEWYRKALVVRPAFAQAHLNLGNTLAMQKKFQAATQEYQRALQDDPASAEAHNNLGTIVLNQGQPEQSVAHYQEAIRLQPGYAEAYGNLCAVLLELRRPDEAAERCAAALRLNPDFAKAQENLLKALAASRQKPR